MNEQMKYEGIKNLADHPAPNKTRAALTLGCTVRHINRMLKGYREQGKEFFIHGNKGQRHLLVVLKPDTAATGLSLSILQFCLW